MAPSSKRLAWRHSLISRTLLQLAIGVGLIILLATWITYELIYRAAETRETAHLDRYNRERAAQINKRCEDAAWNLQILGDAFTERMRQSDPMEFEAFWDNTFERTQDGAWRSVEELSDPRKYPSLWAHRAMIPYPDTKRELLVLYDVMLRFLPAWVRGFGNVSGFTLDEMAIVGFDAAQPDWARKLPADYSLVDDLIGKAGSREGNPDRKLVWTGLRPDTGFGDGCVSAVLPIEMDRQHIITLVHHIPTGTLIETRPDSSVSHLLTDRSGALITFDSGNARLFAKRSLQGQGYDRESDSYYAIGELPGPGWKLHSVLPRSVLTEEAFDSARWVLWSGLASLGLVLLVLGAILRRSVERPIEALVEATSKLAEGGESVRLQSNRRDELGLLSHSFDEMAAKVADRDRALQREKASLEIRVEERTAELREASARLAAALVQEKELVQMKSNFVSMVSHEFRTPLEIITSSAFNLERYQDRLTETQRGELLHTIQNAVERMAAMMVQVVFLGQMEPGRTPCLPASVDLEMLVREIANELEAATAHRCPIQVTTEGSQLQANADAAVLRHIFTNLLSNAIKYSPEGTGIEFHIERVGKEAVFHVRDRGRGIPEADRARLFQAFHRGGNVGNLPGAGLGLVIAKRCVEAHGGSISFLSRDGGGTEFTVSLPLFES